MFSLREYREPTQRLPDYLPWAASSLPASSSRRTRSSRPPIAFRGPDLASSLDAELVSAIARLNNAPASPRLRLVLLRRSAALRGQQLPLDPVGAPGGVDRRRRAAAVLSRRRVALRVELLPHVRLGASRRTRTTASPAFFYDDPTKAAIEHVASARARSTSKRPSPSSSTSCAASFPRSAPLDDEQTLSYLHSTISTHRHPVRVPEMPMYLDAFLPDMALTPGDVPMLGDHFLADVHRRRGSPSTTLPGILDALNHLRVEYRWVTRFICLDKQEAKGLLEKYRQQWWQKRKGLWTLLKEEAAKQESALVDNAAANKAADADAALQELGDDLVSFGFLTTTVTVWDRDAEARAPQDPGASRRSSSRRGFTVKDETLNATFAWLGSLPGHVYANVRRPIVSSLNLAHMMPVSSVWAGDEKNRHLEQVTGIGAPHVLCSTTGDTPFRLHLAVGDVGHTLILGPTGAGKIDPPRPPRPPVAPVPARPGHHLRQGSLAHARRRWRWAARASSPGNERAPRAFQPLAAHRRAAASAHWAVAVHLRPCLSRRTSTRRPRRQGRHRRRRLASLASDRAARAAR